MLLIHIKRSWLKNPDNHFSLEAQNFASCSKTRSLNSTRSVVVARKCPIRSDQPLAQKHHIRILGSRQRRHQADFIPANLGAVILGMLEFHRIALICAACATIEVRHTGP